MRSIPRLSTLICAGCAFLWLSAGAMAKDVLFAGSFCQPADNIKNALRYGRYGPHSAATQGGDSVECPFLLDYSGSLTVQTVTVTVYDRNPSADVSCTVYGIGLDGNVGWSTRLSSSGSKGGPYFLRATVNRLTIGTLHMTCTIPPATSSGVSHVTSYRVITSP